MNDGECPYCKTDIEIDHDDGYGYEEGVAHQQECGNCGKTFVFTTAISFDYDLEKAPCLNGGKHEWEKMVGAPAEYFKNRYRCKFCDEETELSD